MMLSRENVKLALVAAFCLTVPLAAPAVADGVEHALFAHNSDKVDGKHAVSAGATTDVRKGKLVATSSTTGRLPNDIIAKAPDAGLLDGLDSTAFLPTAGKAADADKLDGKDLKQVASQWITVHPSGGVANIWGKSPALTGVTVLRPASYPVGVFCIVLPDGVSSLGAVGAVEQSSGGAGIVSFITVTTAFGNLCNAVGSWDIAVQTYNSAGTPTDRPFTVLIPGGA